MRILLCCNRDFMANLALNQLLPSLSNHTFDIILSNGIGKKSASQTPAITQWQILEHTLIENRLFSLLETRALPNQYQSFEQMARDSESGVIQSFSNINSDVGLEYIRQFNPDVVVSIRFGQIFKGSIIAIPRYGILNLHSGILPNYRGVLATFWAMLHKEKNIGCTLHYVSDGTIDTGEVIGIRILPTDYKRSLLWNIASLYSGGMSMVADALVQCSAGKKIPAIPQDHSLGRYFSFPEQTDVEQFLAQGNRLHCENDYAEIFGWYGLDAQTASVLAA